MRRCTLALLILLGVFLSEAAAINLTPLRLVVSDDGPPRIRYFFQDSDKRLAFRIDSKMAVSGSSEAALFRFEDAPTAAARISKSSSPATVPFDEKGIPVYEALARTVLPAEASDVLLVEQVPDAIMINGWKSTQFTFTYQFFGLSYRRSITFVNFSESEQLVFDVSARESDYGRIYARSYRVLNSLYEVPSDRPAGPT